MSHTKRATPDIQSILRVNQAGEYGAKRIYEGQLHALRGSSVEPTIQHMADQEAQHLNTFNNMCHTRRVRPTLISPVWHVLGYALGYASGKLGEKAAMACTVAVEEVIDHHYQDQLSYLQKKYPDEETNLKEKIKQFRDEELEHRDTGIEHQAAQMPGYKPFKLAVKAFTRLAIEVSKRV